MEKCLIQLEDVYKGFGKKDGRVEVIQGINLEVQQGEFVAIMGKSGCRKINPSQYHRRDVDYRTGSILLQRE